MKSTNKANLGKLIRNCLWSWKRSLRVFVLAAILANGHGTVEAGSLSPVVSLASAVTPSPSNDDYVGTFTDNPNKATFNSNVVPVSNGTISNLEGIFAVLDSNGTTEYALTIQGAYDSATDPPLSAGYRLQPGFGKGANFVPASAVFPELDFDFPLPSPKSTSIYHYQVLLAQPLS